MIGTNKYNFFQRFILLKLSLMSGFKIKNHYLFKILQFKAFKHKQFIITYIIYIHNRI